MYQDRPLFGPGRQEIDHQYKNNDGAYKTGKTYAPNEPEDNWRAQEELKELCTLYLFVVDSVGKQYDVKPTMDWASSEIKHAWCVAEPIAAWYNELNGWQGPALHERMLPHHFAIAKSTYIRHI